MNGTTFTRGLAAGAATALTTLALPALAGAADYCVGQNLGCDQSHTVQTLDHALSLADDNADADKILLAAGVHMPGNGFGFSYTREDAPVEIVGQGAGETIIGRANGATGVVLRLEGGPGTSIHDVTIRVPENATNEPRALSTNNLAHHIAVDEHPIQVGQRFGVDLYEGGVLEDSTVSLDGTSATKDTTAVRVFDGGGSVRRVTVSARTGVYLYGEDGATVERSRITGSSDGVRAYRGVNTLSNSLILFGSSGDGTGIGASTAAGAGGTLNADGVTIVGPGLPWTYGATAGVYSDPTVNATLNLTNSVIRGAESPLYAASNPGATGTATVTASYSDYDPSGNLTDENGSISESNASNVGDAGFAGAAAGDYHLLPGSPLVDAGDPGTAQGLDLDGNPLVTDGNHDGSARRDLGAFEVPGPLPSQNAGGGEQGSGQQLPQVLDTQAPLITGFRATPTRRGPRLRYTLSEAAKVTIRVQRAVPGSRTRYRTIGTLTRNGASGANRTRLSARLRKRVSRPGRYRVRITATDSAGNRSARRTARFRVAAS
ncbi:MAG TPA: choice-of-anchor Q domain-containing protein [Thermoleophilaceae bacterium]|nr:choice-of-anchor Q domain-containing protein [Thermoleophilaceae bacterium]